MAPSLSLSKWLLSHRSFLRSAIYDIHLFCPPHPQEPPAYFRQRGWRTLSRERKCAKLSNMSCVFESALLLQPLSFSTSPSVTACGYFHHPRIGLLSDKHDSRARASVFKTARVLRYDSILRLSCHVTVTGKRHERIVSVWGPARSPLG